MAKWEFGKHNCRVYKARLVFRKVREVWSLDTVCSLRGDFDFWPERMGLMLGPGHYRQERAINSGWCWELKPGESV